MDNTRQEGVLPASQAEASPTVPETVRKRTFEERFFDDIVRLVRRYEEEQMAKAPINLPVPTEPARYQPPAVVSPPIPPAPDISQFINQIPPTSSHTELPTSPAQAAPPVVEQPAPPVVPPPPSQAVPRSA